MALLEEKNTKVKDLLKLIPEEAFANIIKDSKVDFQVKKLYGRNMFYLLLYGLLESSRISTRGLEEVYKSKKFKLLFKLTKHKDIKYNSISTRLANINVEFFEEVYKLVYDKFSSIFDQEEAFPYKICRVDSTMVCEVANKLQEGLLVSNQIKSMKQIKYTISLTDLFPSSVQAFTDQSSSSENIAIHKVILDNIDKKDKCIFVFDRGLSSREKLSEIDDKEMKFVTRINAGARHKVLMSCILPENYKIGNLTILSNELVYLYGKQMVKKAFRLIKTVNEKGEKIWLLTNEFKLSIEEVRFAYKRRWDIEVFFRFIKQELNFKHFISTSVNGIKVILYMTMILAMLILIFKKINGIGYKIAKKRFYYELDEEIMKIAIELSGGDPNLVFR